MSEKILLKDVEAVYVQWAFGDFKLFDGMSEVSAVGKRHDKDGETYLVHYVGDKKEWRYGIATDELRLERRATPAELAPSAPAPTGAEGDSGYTELIDDLSGRIKGLERQLAEADVWYSERFNEGWNGATHSMLAILERTLDNAPANSRISAIEKLIESFRADYPKHASKLPSGGGE